MYAEKRLLRSSACGQKFNRPEDRQLFKGLKIFGKVKKEGFRRGGFLKIRRALLRRKLRDNRLIGGFFNADYDKKSSGFFENI